MARRWQRLATNKIVAMGAARNFRRGDILQFFVCLLGDILDPSNSDDLTLQFFLMTEWLLVFFTFASWPRPLLLPMKS